MTEFLSWAGLIAAGGSIIALIRFWIDIGKVHQKSEDAKAQVAIVMAKLDLLTANVGDYKVSVAETYATNKALSETEQALARGLDNSVQGIFSRLDKMTERLDNLVAIANRSHT